MINDEDFTVKERTLKWFGHPWWLRPWGRHTHTCTHGLTALFPGSPGLAGPPFNLLHHSTRSRASSRLRPIPFMFIFTTSIHVFFGLPLGFGPSTSKTVQPFTQSQSSFLSTCPNHLSLFHFTNTPITSTTILSLNITLVILSLR